MLPTFTVLYLFAQRTFHFVNIYKVSLSGLENWRKFIRNHIRVIIWEACRIILNALEPLLRPIRLFQWKENRTLSLRSVHLFLLAGACLGKGVYFARDASFSKAYATPSTDGSRYMYLARVLVGRHCQGNPELVEPPPRDWLRPEILYDSVADKTLNPKFFAVFADSQCYPEYLITFWFRLNSYCAYKYWPTPDTFSLAILRRRPCFQAQLWRSR